MFGHYIYLGVSTFNPNRKHRPIISCKCSKGQVLVPSQLITRGSFLCQYHSTCILGLTLCFWQSSGDSISTSRYLLSSLSNSTGNRQVGNSLSDQTAGIK